MTFDLPRNLLVCLTLGLALAAPAFGWILVFCVVSADERCPPCIAGEGTLVVRLAFICGATFAICFSPIGSCEHQER